MYLSLLMANKLNYKKQEGMKFISSLFWEVIWKYMIIKI